jgi:5-methylcytosine-specific restriction protein B
VYLTFNQGVTQPKSNSTEAVARATLERRAAELRTHCGHLEEAGFRLDNALDLRTGKGLGKDYESSTIAYKFYARGSVPRDDVIEADLEAVLSSYDAYLQAKIQYKRKKNQTQQVREVRTKDWDRAEATAALLEYVGRRGFVYEPWQVAAYAAALRTKPFAILAGVTGTGKSRLPALVAEGTGGTARLVPVRPDWTDSAEVLGYTDLRGEFRPGVVLDAAREAMGQPRRHWVAVLDEMNLARVEQYFAEVLSRIEDRRPHPRGGFATAPLLHPTLHPGDAWSGVVLPPNLALVGTVNVDESAHGFSRKVLDRAFTLELAEPDLSAWEPAGATGDAEPGWWPVAAWHPRAVALAGLGTPTECERKRIRETVDALASANASLAPAGLQVGYRTRDEAALFVLHAAETPDAFVTRGGDAVDPLDLALGMKVLPRIAGGSDAVRRALLGLLGWVQGGRAALDESDARALLEGWERAGRPAALPGARFPRTAARLALMWERFLAEGFTSFWL